MEERSRKGRGAGGMETGRPAGRGADRRRTGLILAAGAVLLCLSVLMSLLLVLEHLGGLSLPGCGEGGPCEQAANSVWGKVNLGGFEWPVAYLGLAYFFALLAVWLQTRGGLPRILRYLVRFGALVSLGFCVIIVVERTICGYCLAAHAGNFAFWLTMELGGIPGARVRPAAAGLGMAFVLVTAVLGVWDGRHRAAVREEAEGQRQDAAREIIEQAAREGPQEVASEAAPEEGTGGALEQSHGESTPEPPPVETPSSGTISSDRAEQGTGEPETEPAKSDPDTTLLRDESETLSEPQAPEGLAFTGRYRVGPEKAPIRIVVITDYQCRDCYQIEQQLNRLHETRQDISISVKHFPFNTDCNPFVGKTLHGNACWAARAAEAAGLLWGPEGFWKMHVWLFDRRGSFRTTQELEDGIRKIGYDPTGFTRLMTSEETLAPIQADAAEAKALGLHFTPMVFINGVELNGWSAPEALIRTVEEVAAANPPARSAAADRPATAFDKYVSDWREQVPVDLPDDAQAWVMGPNEAPVQVTMWGDYQEAGTVTADSLIRLFAAGRSDVRYAYRHFPVNSDCNPQLEDQRHPLACRASLAAEAAGRLGGNEAYWRMHAWLMENREDFSDQALGAAARGFGFDPDSLMATMERADLLANILQDVRAGMELPKLRHGMPPGIYGVPAIFVNRRFIPRWKLNGEPVLRAILLEAARE